MQDQYLEKIEECSQPKGAGLSNHVPLRRVNMGNDWHGRIDPGKSSYNARDVCVYFYMWRLKQLSPIVISISSEPQ